MRVILDENLPHQLRAHLAKHETATTVYMGWGGFKNGALLKAAEDSGFDVLVTGDLSIERQQNLRAGSSPLFHFPRTTGALLRAMWRRSRPRLMVQDPGRLCGWSAEGSRAGARSRRDHRSDDLA